MELENLRKQEPESGDPFRGNRMFRLAIIALGILAVVGVLIFLLLVLGFCAPNPQATTNPTPNAQPTAVVIVETQAPPTVVAAQPTAVLATATLVMSAPTENATGAANAQPTAVSPTVAAQPTSVPATATIPPTRAATVSGGAKTPTRAASGGEANQGPFAGVYVAGLRYDPPRPVRNDPVNFYATIVNRTGKDQNYPLCAEVYLPDKAKPIGTTDCNMTTIVPGTSEIPIGFWIGTGIKQCIKFRARVVSREAGGEERLALTTDKGGELWTDFSVCP